MLSWNIWDGEPAAWDALLTRFPDSTIYQSHGWGEYKSQFGWTAHRLRAQGNGQTVAVAQILVRRYPLGVAVAWVPGGPVGLLECWDESFREATVQAVGVRHVYCRANVLREHLDSDAEIISLHGWNRPHDPMLSGQTILMDMRMNDDAWLSSINGKHRYRVRKSTAAALNWEYGNTERLRRDLAAVARQLGEEKGIELQETDVPALESLNLALPAGAAQILVGYLDAEPVTACLVLIQCAKAYYVTAATVGRGREVSGAYCMITRLRSILREQKVMEFDFCGIDASSDRARGVYHFKRGFGGRVIRYLGEWEWATSSLLRSVANQLIGRRVRGIQ